MDSLGTSQRGAFGKVGEDTTAPKEARSSRWSARLAPRSWALLIVVLAAVFALVNSQALLGIDPDLRFYLVIPLLWIGVGLIAWWAWRHAPAEKPRFGRRVLTLAVVAGLAQVAFLLLAGLIFGMGNSPYAHSFPAILGNIFFLVTYIGGLEFSRAALFAWGARRHATLSFVLITLLYTVLVVPVSYYSLLSRPDAALPVTGNLIFPRLAESLLATFLAGVGGPAAAFAYHFLVELFTWVSPYLPKLSWMEMALVGTLGPVVLLLVSSALTGKFERTVAVPQEVAPATEKKKGPSVAWLVVAVVALLLVWFQSGAFGVRGFMVSGRSMEPTLSAGDVVVIQDADPASIRVGDIILFQHGETRVVHRVISINQAQGEFTFTTQGDAAQVTDRPVGPQEYKGKVVLAIPRIGWPVLQVQELVARATQ
jgi:signal peptidase